MNIKKGDTVKVMIGKDRGKTGKVLRSFPSDMRILIEGINTVKKHIRPRRQNEKGQVVVVPRQLSASKVLLVCKSCGRATRISHEVRGALKVRICKKCKGVI